jgi:metallo-beta-lactamase family protein
VNKRRQQMSEPPVEPLYTVEDAMAALESFTSHNYQRQFPVAPGVQVTFYDAGHILGSAVTAFDVEEGGRAQRIVYSGDLGRPGLPILRDPQPVSDVDVLIIESTYGDRTHEPMNQTLEALSAAVRQTAERGGKLFIPAFAVGRTQVLIYDLHRLMDAGTIPRMPIFVDSPLAINVTEVFRLHPECYDDETRRFMANDPHGSAFGFDLLTYVRSVEESKALNDRSGPFIVIAASGNAEVGRILHHLRHGLGDPRNTVLIVGYQPPETLGRRLADGMQRVRVFGEEREVRAQVRQLHGYSAHADRNDLLAYVSQMRGRLRRAFTVHGEGGPAQALADGIRALGITDVVLPQPGETFEI